MTLSWSTASPSLAWPVVDKGSVSKKPTAVMARRSRSNGLGCMGKRERATSKIARRAIPFFQSAVQNWLQTAVMDLLSLLPKSVVQTSMSLSKSGINSTGMSSTSPMTRPEESWNQPNIKTNRQTQNAPFSTERNATAFGSVTDEPVLHATAVTSKGEVVNSVSRRLKNPTSGCRHVCAMRVCTG